MSDADKNPTLGFDFAPDWARGSADDYVSRYQSKSYDERTGREERPRRDGDRPRGDRRGPRPVGDRRGPRPVGDRPRGPRHEGDRPRGPRPHGPRPEGDRPRFPRRDPVRPLDAEIRILPNQKNLGSIIKTLQGTHTAFPMKKFVTLFLENPQACLVRFEAKPETETKFWSCKACGFVALSEAEVETHILAEHFGDFFDECVEPCEPPSGNYPCVARCTLTGEWVGAPNHHSYRRRLAEMAAKAGMSERDFQHTLEMCRDPESVEAWKQSVTTQIVYRRRVTEAAPAAPAPASETAPAEGETPAAETPAQPALTRDQAEYAFRHEILPTLVASARHVCLPVEVARRSTSLPLTLLLKYTLRDEQRFPRSLFFALRGAFRHRKFTLFRANDARGPEFVVNAALSPFTSENVVREIRAALDYVTAHPLCTRAELLAALRTELADMDPNTVVRQIAFLFQKGHILEYYNGVLALPEANPKFRKLPEELKKAPAETPAEEAAPAPEAAPEAVAEEPAPEAAPEPAPEPAPEVPAGEAAPAEPAAPEAPAPAAESQN